MRFAFAQSGIGGYRKFLAVLVSVAMLLGVMAGVVWADDGEEPEPAGPPAGVWYVKHDVGSVDCTPAKRICDSVQAAIDEAADGEVIHIYPGTYEEVAFNRDPMTGDAGHNHFGVFVNKAGLTLQGVDANGDPILAADDASMPTIEAKQGSTFGADGVFVQADNVTISGLHLVPWTTSPNKVLEVWGNDFELFNSKIDAFVAGAGVYFSDDRYNGDPHITAFLLEGNKIDGMVVVANGTGAHGTPENTGLVLRNNHLTTLILQGKLDGVAWLLYPVGAVKVEGNTFFPNPARQAHVQAVGEYVNLDWDSILASNTFTNGAVVTIQPDGDVREGMVSGYMRRVISEAIQPAIGIAEDGDFVRVLAGEYSETLTINKSITVAGDPGSVVTGGLDISANDVTVQGLTVRNGAKILGEHAGIYVRQGTSGHIIEDNRLEDQLDTAGARGIIFGANVSNVTVSDNEISGWVTGAYTNPGASDLTFSDNTFSNNFVGIRNDAPVSMSVNGNTFVNNSVEDFGISGVTADVVLRGNFFSGLVKNHDPDGPPELDARNNCWTGAATTEGAVNTGSPWRVQGGVCREPRPIIPDNGTAFGPPAPAMGSGTVDESGGTIIADEANLELTVPAGAVNGEVTFTITPVDDGNAPPSGAGMFKIGKHMYQIEATDANGDPVTQFSRDITLTFHFDLADLGGNSLADLQVYYWDEDLKAWIAIPTTAHANGTVVATVDHLTVFALMADKNAPHFSDISGHWGEADILKLASLGIVSGVGGGKFDPEGPVTRAQFARMIVGALGLGETDAALDFTDAASIPSWAVGYVATAVAEGIIQGMADGSFAPDAHITREQIAVMIARALKLSLEGESDFADNEMIAEWARGAVKSVADRGIVGGIGGNHFAPANRATRAQAARMLSRMMSVRLGLLGTPNN